MGIFKKLISKFKKSDNFVDQLSENREKSAVAEIAKEAKGSYLEIASKGGNRFAKAVDEKIKKHFAVDEALFDDLLEVLIESDLGYAMSERIIASTKNAAKIQRVEEVKLVKQLLIEEMFAAYLDSEILDVDLNFKPGRTNIFLVVGVNGVGKTTSIAKLANYYINQNRKVLVIAGDTYRAAAVEQLKVWSDRVGAAFVGPSQKDTNSAGVIFDGIKKGYEQKYDLVLCDTSGRLENKTHLMKELEKIHQVIQKFVNDAPHESLLVIDSTLGQSGLNQAKGFNEMAKLTGIVLTKLDGTSNGGIIFAIRELYRIPVKLIGTGEKLSDIAPFDLENYLDKFEDSFEN